MRNANGRRCRPAFERPEPRPPGKPQVLSQSRRTIPELSVPTPRPTAATRKSGSKAKGGAFAFRQSKPFQADLGRIVSRQLDKALRDLCRLGRRPMKPSMTCASGSNACGPCCGWFAASWELDSTGKRTSRCETRPPHFPKSAIPRAASTRSKNSDDAKATSRRPPSTRRQRFLKARQRDIHDRLARNVDAMDELREAIERAAGAERRSGTLPRDGRRASAAGYGAPARPAARPWTRLEKETTSETLHECRKQAKYLYHQVQLLQRVGSPDLVSTRRATPRTRREAGRRSRPGNASRGSCRVRGGRPARRQRAGARPDRRMAPRSCRPTAWDWHRRSIATMRATAATPFSGLLEAARTEKALTA